MTGKWIIRWAFLEVVGWSISKGKWVDDFERKVGGQI